MMESKKQRFLEALEKTRTLRNEELDKVTKINQSFSSHIGRDVKSISFIQEDGEKTIFYSWESLSFGNRIIHLTLRVANNPIEGERLIKFPIYSAIILEIDDPVLSPTVEGKVWFIEDKNITVSRSYYTEVTYDLKELD